MLPFIDRNTEAESALCKQNVYGRGEKSSAVCSALYSHALCFIALTCLSFMMLLSRYVLKEPE